MHEITPFLRSCQTLFQKLQNLTQQSFSTKNDPILLKPRGRTDRLQEELMVQMTSHCMRGKSLQNSYSSTHTRPTRLLCPYNSYKGSRCLGRHCGPENTRAASHCPYLVIYCAALSAYRLVPHCMKLNLLQDPMTSIHTGTNQDPYNHP